MSSVIVTELKTDSDWKAVKDEVRAFEEECDTNTYLEWGYQYANWSQYPEGERVWLIRLFNKDRLVGMMFLGEEISSKYGIPVKSLRTLDFSVMHMPPILMRKGYENEACEALVESRWRITFVTGASVIKLFKINKTESIPLIEQLRESKVFVRVNHFNDSYQLDLDEGLEKYLKSKKRKSLYNIRRSIRLLQEETGEILHLERLRGDHLLANKRFVECWKLFEDLRDKSWQLKQAKEISEDNYNKIVKFFRMVVKEWDEKGIVDLVLLRAGDRVVAGQLNTVVGRVQRVILMAYDQSFKDCSPGRVLFFKQLEDSFARGDRQIILGGASEAGKAFWANQIETTLEISWPLGGLRASAWVMYEKLRQNVTE